MEHSWIVLLPPVFVLTCAAFTHNVIISLILGIISSALIATHFAPLETILLIKDTLILQASNIDSLCLFAFLIILGFIIEMMTHSGGITAYTEILQRYVKNKRGAQVTALLLALIFFIDDVMNALTVGAIMRPITDSMRIPRAKLAFLINSVVAPLCVIIPASTWVAMTLGQLQESKISERIVDQPVIFADPLYVYVATIPFLFYALFIIFSAWFIVWRNIGFGSMRQQELIAEETGNVFGGKPPRHEKTLVQHGKGSVSGFFIPIGTFIISVLVFLFYSGNASIMGGTNSLMIALQKANPFLSLFMASTVAMIVSIIYFIIKKQLDFRDLKNNVFHGFMLTKDSILILFFSYTFAWLLTKNLDAGNYLAYSVEGILPLFILPLAIFLISSAIVASIGSSWGTILIVLPITVSMLTALTDGTAPLALAIIPQFYATIGAIIAGSIAGAHFSPITDATVMASMATGCYHMDHVQTQITYATPAFIGTCVSYLVIALLGNFPTLITYGIALFSGLIVTSGILLYRNQNK